MDKLCAIRDIRQAVTRFEADFERRYGISLNEGMVLCSLKDGVTLSSGELGETLGLTPSNASKVIAAAERKGLIERGMGTALLYQRDRFRLLRAESHPVRLPSGRLLATRHLLHACGRLETGDTLDVFVVHFPSRRDGRRQTDPLRRAAARTLREKADSICARRARPYLLVMGDFNEYPSARLFREELQALVPPAPRLPEGQRVPRKYRRALAENTDPLRPGRLYNLAAPLEHARPGTYKYQGVWGVLDHILVSGTLLAPGSPLRVEARCAEPGAFPFLLQRDGKYLGLRPYRTYYGYQYQAEGTSDHLPLILRCRLRAGE